MGEIQDYVVTGKATAASGKYCDSRIAAWQKKFRTSSLCRSILITTEYIFMKLFLPQFSQKESGNKIMNDSNEYRYVNGGCLFRA